MLPEHPSLPLRLCIDTVALTENWRALDRLSGAARAGAAVKANGYGVGAVTATRALADAGCRDFFVAHSWEAAEISDVADPASVSVLHGPHDAADAAYLKQAGFRPVINSLRQAQLWIDAQGGACDLMVDTGINRLGLPMDELHDPLLERLSVQTLLSHLASADEDSPLNEAQRQKWAAACAIVPARDVSLANSAGIALGSAYHGTVTRPGLSLYGGIPRSELAQHVRQTVQPQAAILQIRSLAAGDTVGYNATFVAPKSMRVGVIALGYADGYLRTWSDKGAVRHNGVELPVIGRVSMDMTVIDLSAAAQAREGDWVDVAYALPEAAARSGLSQYELLTLLGRRFPR